MGGIVAIVIIWAMMSVCSAQTVLPAELQGSEGFVLQLRMHFCTSMSGQCGNTPYAPLSLCWYICMNTAKNKQCEAGPTMPCREPGFQKFVCGYSDAFVCRYSGRRGSCVYSTSTTTSPFCICRDNTGNFSSTMQQNGTCSTDGELRLITTTPASRPTDNNDQLGGGAPLNVTAVALGVTLTLVLLVVILLVFLWRRGKLPALTKRPTTTTESPGAELASNRAHLPTPVEASNTEYAYAYDHWLRRPNNTVHLPGDENDHSTNVDEQSAEETGNQRYVTDGPGSALSDNCPSTEASNSPHYFSIEPTTRPPEDRQYSSLQTPLKDTPNEDQYTPLQSATEASNGQQYTPLHLAAKGSEDHAYSEVSPSPERPSHTVSPAYEEVHGPRAEDGNGGSSAYHHIGRVAGQEQMNVKGNSEYDHIKLRGSTTRSNVNVE